MSVRDPCSILHIAALVMNSVEVKELWLSEVHSSSGNRRLEGPQRFVETRQERGKSEERPLFLYRKHGRHFFDPCETDECVCCAVVLLFLCVGLTLVVLILLFFMKLS